MWDPRSLTRRQTGVPCIARQILNSWATKEVSIILIFNSWGKRDKIWGLLVAESEFDHNVKLLLGSVKVYPPNYTFGCFLRLCVHAKSLQPCLTLFDSMDCSRPGSSPQSCGRTHSKFKKIQVDLGRKQTEPPTKGHSKEDGIQLQVQIVRQ